MRRTDEMIDRQTLAEANITQDEFDRLEWELAIAKHVKAYDRDDVQSDAYENADALIAALDSGDLLEAGRILNSARTKTAARRASIELIGAAA